MLRASLIAPGVERGDLAQVLVGGADEAGGVRHLADVHRVGVDAVALQPGAVVGEVGADRADQHRPQPELPIPKAMLAAIPPRTIDRSSTRNDSETLSSWSASSCSANRPGKCIRWSVAIEPVTAICTVSEPTVRS